MHRFKFGCAAGWFDSDIKVIISRSFQHLDLFSSLEYLACWDAGLRLYAMLIHLVGHSGLELLLRAWLHSSVDCLGPFRLRNGCALVPGETLGSFSSILDVDYQPVM